MSMIEDIDSSLISDTNDFLLHLEEHLSSQQPKKVDLYRAQYLQDLTLVEEARQYICENELGLNLEPLHMSGTEEDEAATTRNSGRLSSLAVKQIEERVSKRFQAILEICAIDGFQREGTGIGKYLETASDEEKLKWVEENVEVQRKDLLQARHQIPRLRQNSLREYFDYFATLDMAIRIMMEILQDTTLHDQKHYRTYENYMSSLSESLILKLDVLNCTMRVNTYDPDTVQALQVIRASLETQYEELRKRLEETDAKLDAYKSQGPDFEEIAKSYAQAIDKIRDTKDHIARISSTV